MTDLNPMNERSSGKHTKSESQKIQNSIRNYLWIKFFFLIKNYFFKTQFQLDYLKYDGYLRYRISEMISREP